jgi:hypothetical protein
MNNVDTSSLDLLGSILGYVLYTLPSIYIGTVSLVDNIDTLDANVPK